MRSIVLIIVFLIAAAHSFCSFASSDLIDEGEAIQRISKKTSEPQFPITSDFIKKLSLETLQKSIDIYDAAIKKGMGSKDMRSEFKLAYGLLTPDQVVQSMTMRSIGKELSSSVGFNYRSMLSSTMPEAKEAFDGLIYDCSFKRAGYLNDSFGVLDSAFGNFFYNFMKDPTEENLYKESKKFLKNYVTAFTIAFAGYYHQSKVLAPNDYLSDEFQMATCMAAGGALSYFTSSIFIELADYYTDKLFLHIPIIFDSWNKPKTVSKGKSKTLDSREETSITKAPLSLKRKIHFGLVNISYEFGSYLGESLYRFSPATLTMSSYEEELRSSKEAYGTLAASITNMLWMSVEKFL